jgi:hypothetical protein
MFTNTKALRSVAMQDVQQAQQFYGGTPVLRVSEPTDGPLHLPVADGDVPVCREPGNAAASFDTAVDELVGCGVGSQRHDQPATGATGIDRAADVAWLTDPAGTILPVLACAEGSTR